MVDMTPGSVTARLQRMAELSAASPRVPKGVDMSSDAITARLVSLGALSAMCRRLVAIGRAARGDCSEQLEGGDVQR